MTQDEIAQAMQDSAGNSWGNEAHFQRFAALIANAEREACVKECKKLLKVFLSSKYSTGQPLSSFKERHAVAACIELIEARGQA